MYFAHAAAFEVQYPESKECVNDVPKSQKGQLNVFEYFLSALGFNLSKTSDSEFALLNTELIHELVPKLKFDSDKEVNLSVELYKWRPTRYPRCLVHQLAGCIDQDVSNILHLSNNLIYIIHGDDEFRRDQSIAQLNHYMRSLDKRKNLFIVFKTYNTWSLRAKRNSLSVASLPCKSQIIREAPQNSTQFRLACSRLVYRQKTFLTVAQNDWHTFYSAIWQPLLETKQTINSFIPTRAA